MGINEKPQETSKKTARMTCVERGRGSFSITERK